MKTSQPVNHRKYVKKLNFPNNFHELTFSCYRNLDLLEPERACLSLERAIVRACDKLEYGVFAYVFMPNHVHLLVKPLNYEYSISDFLKSVKQSTARNELKYLRENEPDMAKKLLTYQNCEKYRFWKDGGGYDRNIINENTLEKAMNYIHNNPVKKEFVKHAIDWKWSSARAWIENRQGVIPIMKGQLLYSSPTTGLWVAPG
ncbi:MAG: transposase [bacterium]